MTPELLLAQRLHDSLCKQVCDWRELRPAGQNYLGKCLTKYYLMAERWLKCEDNLDKCLLLAQELSHDDE